MTTSYKVCARKHRYSRFYLNNPGPGDRDLRFWIARRRSKSLDGLDELKTLNDFTYTRRVQSPDEERMIVSRDDDVPNTT